MEKAWVREARDRFPANAVAFFLKQWGGLWTVENSMGTNGANSYVSPG
jgi:protein gp37